MVMALWDMVAKAANLAQLLGLDAVTLITTIATSSFRRFHQANKECRKLEGRVRMLGRLLLTSGGGRWINQQHDDDLPGLLQVTSVLREAQELVESYKRSSLYALASVGPEAWPRGVVTCEAASTPAVTSSSPSTPSSSSCSRRTRTIFLHRLSGPLMKGTTTM